MSRVGIRALNRGAAMFGPVPRPAVFWRSMASDASIRNAASDTQKVTGDAQKVTGDAQKVTSDTPRVTNSTRRVTNDERELPDPFADKKQNRRYFWIYSVGVFVLCAVIFNYEKTRSPIINSVLYCLRRSEEAKSRLGANIGFRSSWPWVWGPLNTVKGHIDVEFGVKGDEGQGTLRLKATRTLRLVPFDIHHFTLETAGGEVDLMKDPTLDFEL